MLEAADVEHDDGEALPVGKVGGEKRFQVLVEEVAVAEPGELVMEREMVQLALEGLPLRDVPDDASERPSPQVLRVAEGHLHRGDAAVLGDAEQLDGLLEPQGGAVLVVYVEVFAELRFVVPEHFYREKLRYRLADQLLALEAEHVLDAGVREEDREALVEAKDGLVDGFGERDVLFLLGLQLLEALLVEEPIAEDGHDAPDAPGVQRRDQAILGDVGPASRMAAEHEDVVGPRGPVVGRARRELLKLVEDESALALVQQRKDRRADKLSARVSVGRTEYGIGLGDLAVRLQQENGVFAILEQDLEAEDAVRAIAEIDRVALNDPADHLREDRFGDGGGRDRTGHAPIPPAARGRGCRTARRLG